MYMYMYVYLMYSCTCTCIGSMVVVEDWSGPRSDLVGTAACVL